MARRLFGAEGKALEGRRVIELFEAVERSQLAGLLEDAFRARPTREVSLNAGEPGRSRGGPRLGRGPVRRPTGSWCRSSGRSARRA